MLFSYFFLSFNRLTYCFFFIFFFITFFSVIFLYLFTKYLPDNTSLVRQTETEILHLLTCSRFIKLLRRTIADTVRKQICVVESAIEQYISYDKL